MFNLSCDDVCCFFIEIWCKQCVGEILMLLEVIVVDWIVEYFEYYDELVDVDGVVVCNYMFEEGWINLFLYLLMYFVISEQLLIDQLFGICVVYDKLVVKFDLIYDVQYVIMECFGEMIWEVQCINMLFDIDVYLQCILCCVLCD